VSTDVVVLLRLYRGSTVRLRAKVYTANGHNFPKYGNPHITVTPAKARARGEYPSASEAGRGRRGPAWRTKDAEPGSSATHCTRDAQMSRNSAPRADEWLDNPRFRTEMACLTPDRSTRIFAFN